MMIMLRLIIVQLKVAFGLSALKWYSKKSPLKFWGGMGIVALVILGLAPIFYLYTRLVQGVYDVAFTLGQPQVVLTMAVVLSAVLVFFFGIAYVMSAFFFSRDLPMLIPLPLLPRDILAAKFAQILVINYLTISPFYLPSLFVYGLRAGEGFLYWLMGVLLFVALPLVPLMAATALVLTLMRLTNLSQRKDTLRTLGMVAILVLVLGLNFFLNRVPAGQEEEFVQRLLQDQGLIHQMARTYPPAGWATMALTAAGSQALLNAIGFMALSGAGLAVMFLLADRLFFQGLIGGDEIQAGKKLGVEVFEKKISRVSSPVMAIAAREIKLLIRTPIYLFNSVGIFIILPLVMLIPATSMGGFEPYIDMIRNQDTRVLVNLGGGAFMGLMTLFAPAASSSFSREGRTIWLSKIIPVAPAEQVRGKILYSFALSFLALPLLLFLSSLGIHWTPGEFLLVALVGTALAFPAITSSLLIDMLRPFLDWDNPQRAIKQNANVLFAMVAGGAQFYLIYLLVSRVTAANDSDLWVYFSAITGPLVLGLVSYLALMGLAESRFQNIQG